MPACVSEAEHQATCRRPRACPVRLRGDGCPSTSVYASERGTGSTTTTVGGITSTGQAPAACVPVAIPANSSAITCASFCFQKDAQTYYDTFAASQLDGNDQDGLACEQLPHKPATGR